jgi:serine/threonine-protein kinase
VHIAPAPAPVSATASRANRALPCRFGRYTLFDRIGHGGMADIYLARVRTELGAARLCVVKEVAPRHADGERFAEMLAAEARLAARLRHASVVQVEDLGREDGALFIAMEYVEGLDLRELLRRAARQRVSVPVEFSLLVIAEALRALAYAHRMGVIHRDVSPSNVLVSFDGEVKLCDFGIARAAGVADLTADEALQGKAGYMSPEHARGEAIDERADVFAAGILLWELLAGRRLYGAGRASPSAGREGLLALARRAEIPPLPERRLPDEGTLHAIAMRALEPRPDDRYPSAAAMLRDLERYAACANLLASPLRFGAWVREHFGAELVAARRARERALRALDLGPPAVLEAIPPARPEPPLGALRRWLRRVTSPRGTGLAP